MTNRTKPRRRLHLEPLEPRWTMDAALCPADPVSPAYDVCAITANSAAALQADVQRVEQSLNQFALDLYRTISDSSTQPTDEAISPFSIAAALAMTYAGASGETASQLAHALHIDLPPDRFHAAMETILKSILRDEQSGAATLEIANSLWGQLGFPFLDSFRQLTHDRYGADFHEADFKHAPDEARDAINDWVKNQTHGMIPKLFDQLSDATRLVLANALYFKASWAKAFNMSSTQRTVFHLASGASVDVSMMHSGGYFSYIETSDYQIAELPYEGGRYSMVVLLPKQTGANLTANFSAADLQQWIAAMRSTDLSVALPKFKLETSMSLVDTLKSLGVTDAFDDRSANFSGIDGRRDLYIDQAVHKAVVEVNETGTKAAAATGISISMMSDAITQPRTPIPFYADHPFHFLIRDRQTNSILFLGQVQQPTAYDGNDQAAVELPKTNGSVTTNPANQFDVNADGEENPLDAVIVINYLNGVPSPFFANLQTALPTSSQIYPDVDGDGYILPLDALILINRLNGRSNPALAAVPALDTAPAQGEGESAASQPFNSAAVDLLLGLDEFASVAVQRGKRSVT
jgi:serine protease inhibitor